MSKNNWTYPLSTTVDLERAVKSYHALNQLDNLIISGASIPITRFMAPIFRIVREEFTEFNGKTIERIN